MNTIQKYLLNIPTGPILNEIDEIRGNRRHVSFLDIRDAVKDNPGQFAYLEQYIFCKNMNHARRLVTYIVLSHGWIKDNNGSRSGRIFYAAPGGI